MTSVERHLEQVPEFYLDNFDIVDREIGGLDSYQLILRDCPLNKVIPVIGLDRHPSHNEAAIIAKREFGLEASVIALRLGPEDFQEFLVVEAEVQALLAGMLAYYDQVDLVFDCRICSQFDAAVIGQRVNEFWGQFSAMYPVRRVIVTGSSIPASIGDVVPPNSAANLFRNELNIHQIVDEAAGNGDLAYGDYGVVSPNYSDVDLQPEILLNVMAPKMLYTYAGHHFCIRGGAIKGHPRGYKQYNDFSGVIVSQPFYRGAGYSYGDNFILEKSNNIGSQVTPSSVLRPTINAHLTYMWDSL
jgi:hypothetical protein